jgi:hypothetical protein
MVYVDPLISSQIFCRLDLLSTRGTNPKSRFVFFFPFRFYEFASLGFSYIHYFQIYVFYLFILLLDCFLVLLYFFFEHGRVV